MQRGENQVFSFKLKVIWNYIQKSVYNFLYLSHIYFIDFWKCKFNLVLEFFVAQQFSILVISYNTFLILVLLSLRFSNLQAAMAYKLGSDSDYIFKFFYLSLLLFLLSGFLVPFQVVAANRDWRFHIIQL